MSSSDVREPPPADASVPHRTSSDAEIVGHRVARMPWGEPISPEFLSRKLFAEPPVRDFRVDEASIIDGRHSMTFRLLLDRRPSKESKGGACSTQQGMPDTPHNVGETNSIDAIREFSNACAPLSTSGGCSPRNSLNMTTVWPTSVYVKKMVCKELPARPLVKWRSSISSYRAEASFFKALAGSPSLSGIAPRCFWVHIDDRRDVKCQATGARSVSAWAPSRRVGEKARATRGEGTESSSAAEGTAKCEEEEMDALRASSFMIVTEDLGADSTQGSQAEAAGEHGTVGARAKKTGGWEQVGAMDLRRVRLALSTAARLHAVFWQELWPTSHPSRARLGPKLEAPPSHGVEEFPVSAAETEERADVAEKSDSHPAGKTPDGATAASCGGGSRYAPGLHEQGTFWSLDKRDPGDVAGLAGEFEGLLSRFREVLPASWFDGLGGTGEAALGRRLAARARDLDAAARGVRPAGDIRQRSGGAVREGRGRTLVHGDLKTWNIFFRSDEGSIGAGGPSSDSPDGKEIVATGAVRFIDWQWCGEGLAAADVAYLICTSMDVPTLAREEELLDHYHAELRAHLEDRGRGEGCGNGATFHGYSREEFRDDYRVAFLDYVRCVVGTLWKGLTPEKMARNKDAGPGMSLINRSAEHMVWIIRRATHLLDELDGVDEHASEHRGDAVDR